MKDRDGERERERERERWFKSVSDSRKFDIPTAQRATGQRVQNHPLTYTHLARSLL